MPLAPGEAANLLDGHKVASLLSPEDVSLAHLLAEDVPIRSIGRRLGVSDRTVQRRVARLRETFASRSTSELCTELARRGF